MGHKQDMSDPYIVKDVLWEDRDNPPPTTMLFASKEDLRTCPWLENGDLPVVARGKRGGWYTLSNRGAVKSAKFKKGERVDVLLVMATLDVRRRLGML